MSQPVKFDYSARSTVAVCQLCPWRDVATTRGAVLRAAAVHMALTHDDPNEAGRIADRARRLRGEDRTSWRGTIW